MANTIVKQPNGNFSVFCDYVSDFILFDASCEELRDFIVTEASRKLQSDIEGLSHLSSESIQANFNAYLDRIADAYGDSALLPYNLYLERKLSLSLESRERLKNSESPIDFL